MKISHEKKQENREAILQAAVNIIIEKGFKAATMRAMAREAGLGDATIYNYFPTKESLLYAYYEGKLAAAADQLAGVPGLEEYSFKEKLQAYFETCLENFLADREFLQETFRLVFYPVTPPKELQAIKAPFQECLSRIFDSAVENGEIQEPPFRDLSLHLFWDYFLGVVFYWLKDASECFSDTTELIDKTMDLASAVLAAGLVNKVFDIVTFLFRNHIVSRLDTFRGGLDAFSQVRRAFTEEVCGKPATGK
ncbi:MAG: TetR family transcriptional regulator [Deltaproteobacteria bacterium]|nr:TetR family transcriptional regulator [Deltaproteobacteria bacterium]